MLNIYFMKQRFFVMLHFSIFTDETFHVYVEAPIDVYYLCYAFIEFDTLTVSLHFRTKLLHLSISAVTLF